MIDTYWFIWVSATLINGLVAGFMIGYALLLGRFLSWMMQFSKRAEVRSAYVMFRQTHGRPGVILVYVLGALQLLLGLLFIVFSFLKGQNMGVALVAGSAGVLWQATYFLTGFGGVESKVLGDSAELDDETVRRFTILNVPLHIIFAALSFTAFILLLTMPF
ncbi:MAG: hypothetical protein WAP51_04090 [Candidatus Sungiibacteriota bacterium]